MNMPGQPLPRSRARSRREQDILAVVREELTQAGYDGVTMQRLADRIGVVKKTLYNRYGSKDGLLLAAIAEVIDGYRAEAFGTEPGIPAIIAVNGGGVRQLLATPEYAQAMARAVLQADPEHPLVALLLADAIADQVHHLEIAARKEELLPGVDLRPLAEQLTAHTWGLVLLWSKGLLPLTQYEHVARTGLLTQLLAVTRGPRHDELAAMLASARREQIRDSRAR